MRAFGVLVLLGGCNRVFELSPPPDAPPAIDAAIACTAVEVMASGGHTCARHSDGHVSCWGHNTEHEVGAPETLCSANDGEFRCIPSPYLVPGVTEAVGLGMADQTSCALLVDGVTCWGRNQDGELGSPIGNQANPRRMADLQVVTTLRGGERHVCTLDFTDRTRCAGNNDHGQLGTGTLDPSNRPVEIVVPSAGQLAAGFHHTCIVAATDVYCWGRNDTGQATGGPSMPVRMPTQVLVSDVKRIAAGANHTCAARSGGDVACWGSNAAGQLGTGDRTPAIAPVTALIADVTQVSVGVDHTCALQAGGQVSCWGAGINYPDAPMRVDLMRTATQITSGSYHVCALLDDGSVWCWGSNWYGQLGDGTVSFPDFLPPRQAKLCP